jgi:hypothetical protein
MPLARFLLPAMRRIEIRESARIELALGAEEHGPDLS